MQNPAPIPGGGARFEWVDSIRGMAILWIVYYHGFLAYGGRYPWPIKLENFGAFIDQCAPASLVGTILCWVEGLISALIQRGAQGVGVFLLFSGFGLTYSLVKKKGAEPAWRQWYGRRLFRLFPLYWVAHLVFLISPIQYHPDPVDYRFLLSLLGDRIYPVREMFFYFVPSWWFFGLLLELYVFFPLLFRSMQRLGSAKFMALCIAATSISRYLLFAVFQADGNWVMGAFFVCRLWEFAAGMVLGKLLAEEPEKTTELLFSAKGLLAGIVVYAMGLYAYEPNFLYVFSDGLTAMGLTVIMVHVALWVAKVPGLAKAFAKAGTYSYGLYLFHQPFVMYAGDKLQPYTIGIYLVVSSAVIAGVTLVSMCLEYGVNRVLERLRTS